MPLLEGRYAASPYVALLRGEEPYGYQELEDSLRTFARLPPRRDRRRATPPAAGPTTRCPTAAPGPPPRRGLEP